MTLTPNMILAIGSGGFLGAISRVYINSIVTKTFPHELPFGILSVNIIGSFAIGILFAIFMHYSVSDTFKAFITTGFLGALTTYSTFAIDSFLLLNTSIFLGLSNMALNLFGSVIAAGSGYKLVFFIIK